MALPKRSNAQFFKTTYSRYDIPGKSSYYVVNGILYQTGDVTKSVRPATDCQIIKGVTDQPLQQAFGTLPAIDLPLTLTPAETTMNSFNVQHYQGKTADGTRTVDLWLSTDKNVPVKLVDQITNSGTDQATAIPGTTAITIRTEYNLLAADQDVKITAPLVCTKR